MKAILYVAGRGTRLGPRAQERPKVLLELGGRSLLERHLENLAAVGVGPLVVVTGHQGEMVRAALRALKGRTPVGITERHNPDFTEGSVLSLGASLPDLEGLDGPALLMDGDVLYAAEMLRRLIQSPHRTALLIDRNYSTANDDPVLVPVRQGRPVDFVKQWKGEAELVGESIGFFKLDPADAPLLVQETRKRCAGPGRAESYDDVLRVLVRAGRFGCEDVTGLPWTEIDFPEDLAYAEKTVLPAMREAGR